MTPEEIRHAFPITSTRAYLFSGGLAPAATPVRAAHDRWTDAWMYDSAAPYASYQVEWELARQRFAMLIGAEPGEVALVDHTSRGANLIVQMIAAPDGGNVVVDEYTYPSSIYPWQLTSKRNTELRLVTARDHRVHMAD